MRRFVYFFGSSCNRIVFIDVLDLALNAVGDDAQLANVDLQNRLQKQQQMLQMISNISKAISDNTAAIIRNIGG